MSNNNSVTNSSTSKKSRRKFNIIDFFILLVIVAVISALVYAFSPWSQLKALWQSNEISFQYAVEIRNVDYKNIDLIQNGDTVLNSVTKNAVGTVTGVDAVQKSSQLYYSQAEDDTYQGVLVESQDKYDITVYITATAQYEAGVGYTVNGSRIAVGEILDLRFPQYADNGYCIAVATGS